MHPYKSLYIPTTSVGRHCHPSTFTAVIQEIGFYLFSLKYCISHCAQPVCISFTLYVTVDHSPCLAVFLQTFHNFLPLFSNFSRTQYLTKQT